jgi:HSP20 family molecular chaperone IbpA
MTFMENCLRISIEVPGLRRGLLEITAEGCVLTIFGCPSDRFGPFDFNVDIPAGYDAERGKAIYRNGELRIEVPKLQSDD